MDNSNVLYEGWKVTPHITQDDETNDSTLSLGKGEVGYNVGITTVKSLSSPSVYTHRSVETRARVILEHYCSPALIIFRNGVTVYTQRNKLGVIMEVNV